MNLSTKTIGIKELAEILHKKPSTIGEDVTRRPHALPPRLNIPGSRLVLWRLVDVEEWLADRVAKPIGRPRRAA